MYSSYGKLPANNSIVSSKNTNENTSSVRVTRYESDLEAMQREIDNYTRRMEQEKRRYFTIQEAHKAVTKVATYVLNELEQHQQKLKEAKRQSCGYETAQMTARIKNLECNIETAIATYDGILAHNNKLKNDIDRLRRDKKNNRDSTATLTQTVANLEKYIREQEESCYEKNRRNLERKNYIQSMSTQNDRELQLYSSTLNGLQETYNSEKALRERQRGSEPTVKAETVDTYPILKQRLKKLISRNNEKTKFIEQYQRHLSSIEEAFNHIKSITGLNEFEEITSTFIKAEEQNTSLYSYIILLSQNIEGLNDSIKFKKNEIQKLRDCKEDIVRSYGISNAEWQYAEKLQATITEKLGDIHGFNELLRSAQPILTNTIKKLREGETTYEPEAALYNALFEMDIDANNVEYFLSAIDKQVNKVVEERYCSGTVDGKITEGYNHDPQRIPPPPNVGSEDERYFILFTEQDFRRFAEEYIDKRRSNKPRE